MSFVPIRTSNGIPTAFAEYNCASPYKRYETELCWREIGPRRSSSSEELREISSAYGTRKERRNRTLQEWICEALSDSSRIQDLPQVRSSTRSANGWLNIHTEASLSILGELSSDRETAVLRNYQQRMQLPVQHQENAS